MLKKTRTKKVEIECPVSSAEKYYYSTDRFDELSNEIDSLNELFLGNINKHVDKLRMIQTQTF